MAKVIIGIHGLGNKPPGQLLEKWWKMSMIEGLKLNGHNKRLPRFELVYWADVIHSSPRTSQKLTGAALTILMKNILKPLWIFMLKTMIQGKRLSAFSVGR